MDEFHLPNSNVLTKYYDAVVSNNPGPGEYGSLSAALRAAKTGWTIYIRDIVSEPDTINCNVDYLTLVGRNRWTSGVEIAGANNITFNGVNLTVFNLGLYNTNNGNGRFIVNGLNASFDNTYMVHYGSVSGNPLVDFTAGFAHLSNSSYTNTVNMNNVGYGVRFGLTVNEIVGCTFNCANTNTSGHEILVFSDGQNKVTGCSFYTTSSNNITFIKGGAETQIVGNSFRGSGSGSQYAINNISYHSTISGNTIFNMTRCINVNGYYITVTGNAFYIANSGYGIWLGSDLQNSIISNNAFRGNAVSSNYGIYNSSGARVNCTITGNNFVNLATGIEGSPSVAGTNSVYSANTFSSCTNDMNNHRLSDRTDLIRGNSFRDNSSMKFENNLQTMKNTSGGTVAAGKTVIMKTTANTPDEFTTTTTAADPKVIGITMESIANNGFGKILTEGWTSGTADVDSTIDVAVGDYLCTHTTAGALRKAASGEIAIAIAREARTADTVGQIDVYVIKPTQTP